MDERTCSECGAPLIGRGPKALTCSTACRWRRADRRKSGRNVKPCAWCGKSFGSMPVKKRTTCSHACTVNLKRTGSASPLPWAECSCGKWYIARNNLRSCGAFLCRYPNYPHVRFGTPVDATCQQCDSSFTYPAGGRPRRYCSDECAANTPTAIATRKRSKRRRRARKRNAICERYDAHAIHERDQWTCKLCGKRVKRNAVVPHPLAPTIDHVVPLAQGGDDTPANVQCAHFQCNSLKGDRTTDTGEQLRLLG